MNHLLRFSLLVICVCFAAAAFAQRAGSLDTTFNHTGIVYNTINSDSDNDIFDIAVQPADGKIVAVGYTYINLNGFKRNFAILRYNTDGSLDTSFNKTGYLIINIDSGDQVFFTSVVIQPNGKILALGTDSIPSFFLIRLNTNGTFDTTFATNGINSLPFYTGIATSISMLLQGDGKILAGGTFSENDFGIARYDSTGELDTTFGNKGIAITVVGNTSGAILNSIAFQDSNIIAAGTYVPYDHFRMALARFNSNGSIDPTFGTNGIDTTGDDNYYTGEPYDVAVQSDNKIVVGGPINKTHIDGFPDSFAVARYNPNGGFDTTFGEKGIVISQPGSEFYHSLLIQPDGKILAGGEDVNFILLRYNSNGTADTSFGDGGKVFTDILGDSYANAVALQSDGKIIAAGNAGIGSSQYFALARYNNTILTGILHLTSAPTNILTYPNPVHNIETLDYTLTNTETLTINLYDVTGRVIRNYMTNVTMQSGEHKQQLNFENLAAGNYILTISNEERKTESVKIIRQ